MLFQNFVLDQKARFWGFLIYASVQVLLCMGVLSMNQKLHAYIGGFLITCQELANLKDVIMLKN